MNLEFFIARRLATDGGKPGVMVRIAGISVALGMAVMILTLAVIMGFKREVTRKVTGFGAHVAVTDIRGVHALDSEPVRRTPHLDSLIRSTEGFASLYPYALKGGIVKTSDAVLGVMLKGVDGTFGDAFFRACLEEGDLPRVADTIRTKDILISRTMADQLQAGVGDKVEMLFVGNGEAPRRDRYRVSGIYRSGMEEMDRTMMLTDLRNVQRLAGWAGDEITGYEVRTTDFSRVDEFARRIETALLRDDADETRNLAAVSIRELYPNIFDWLRAHDVNAAVVIAIMLLVALFNMASALLILVLERTRMIGLLKAMGMRDGAVQRIFLWRAGFIVVRGLVWGNAAGLALCLVQRWFHVVKLSSEGYLLSEVPVAFGWGWWLLLNAGVVVVTVLLLTLPARVISSVKPDETIKYD